MPREWVWGVLNESLQVDLRSLTQYNAPPTASVRGGKRGGWGREGTCACGGTGAGGGGACEYRENQEVCALLCSNSLLFHRRSCCGVFSGRIGVLEREGRVGPQTPPTAPPPTRGASASLPPPSPPRPRPGRKDADAHTREENKKGRGAPRSIPRYFLGKPRLSACAAPRKQRPPWPAGVAGAPSLAFDTVVCRPPTWVSGRVARGVGGGAPRGIERKYPPHAARQLTRVFGREAHRFRWGKSGMACGGRGVVAPGVCAGTQDHGWRR